MGESCIHLLLKLDQKLNFNEHFNFYYLQYFTKEVQLTNMPTSFKTGHDLYISGPLMVAGGDSTSNMMD